jgi:hypothetical protein
MSDLSNRVIHTDLQMQIVARDKAVFLLFSRQPSDSGDLVPAMTDNFLMPSDVALLASQKLADLAFEADEGLRMPSSHKAALIEKHRAVLVPRLGVIFNSQRENKTLSNEQLARQIVDVVSAEIFG